MSNNYFCFKQFAIVQDNTPMKVGTDGVLLGAWCKCQGARRILDIGTGTGLIAIMAAQRTSSAQIDAVEMEPSACVDAIENIGNCPWQDRIELYNTTIQDFAADCANCYNLIVSNPPFFSNSLKASDAARSLARHDDSLPVADLFGCSVKLLAPGGILSVIIPVGRLDDFRHEASLHSMDIVRQLRVQPNNTLPCHRVLVEFGIGGGNQATDEGILVIEHEQGCYSPEYVQLTHDFYLKF